MAVGCILVVIAREVAGDLLPLGWQSVLVQGLQDYYYY